MKKAIPFLSCVVISLLVAFPFLWMLLTSLKTYPDIYKFPLLYMPSHITLEHYINVFKSNDLEIYLVNSLVISLGTVILTIALALFPAYALSRLRFRSRRFLIRTVVFSMVLPQILLVIPFLKILRIMGLSNTREGLILVYLALTTPVAIWFLIGFFDNIPQALEDAALIDGCSRLQTLIKIILPIMRPAVASVAIYSFFIAWNEFMFALSYLNSSRVLTLPIFLGRFVGQYQTRWGELFAGSVISYLVPLLSFTFLQKQFISALAKGAVKE